VFVKSVSLGAPPVQTAGTATVRPAEGVRGEKLASPHS
jgi:hypothetical protein